MNPLVSIIIPIYNSDDFLRDTLDSVITQTYKNIEIVLVNDGSTDKSGEIIDEYAKKDARITAIHIENGGVSNARNTGYEVISGEFVYYVDSDDCMKIDALEKMVRFALENDLDIVNIACEKFHHDGKEVEVDGHYEHPELEDGKVYTRDEYLEEVSDTFMMIYTYFIRKSITDELMWYPGIIHEDVIYIAKMFYFANKIGYLNEHLYSHQKRPNSLISSNDHEADAKGYLIAFRELKAFWIRKHEARAMSKAYSKYLINKVHPSYYLFTINGLNLKKKISFSRCGNTEGKKFYMKLTRDHTRSRLRKIKRNLLEGK